MLSEQPLSKDPSLSFWLQQRGFMFCQCSARIPSSLSFTVWLAGLRGAGGALGCFRFRQIWLPFVFCRCFRTGVSMLEVGGVSLFCAHFDRVLVLAVRLEVRVCVALRLQLFLRMRFRLLYLCLCAWPPCCRSVVGVVVFLDVSGSGRAREVRQRFAGTGHQVRLHVSLCRCSAFALSANASL